MAGLKFADNCEHCQGNRKYLVETKESRIATIDKIIESRETTESKFNKAQKYLNLIPAYIQTKKMNRKIKINNDEFDRLQLLKHKKEIIEKTSAINIYNTISKNNIIVENNLQLKNLKKIKSQISVENENKKINDEIKKYKKKLNDIREANQDLKILDLTEKYNADSKQLAELNIKISKYISYKNYINKTKLENISIKLNKLEIKIRNEKTISKLKCLKTDRISILYNQKISQEINLAESELLKLNEQIKIANKKYQELLFKRTTLIEKIKRYQYLAEKSGKHSDDLQFLTIYQKCVDKKNGISQKILVELCNLLNIECNRILQEISDFEIEISINSKQILRIYTIESGIKIPASMSSGYQKFVMDLIMRIVLTTILCDGKSNNISNPNILIVDEGFGCLDKKNFVEVARIMQKLKHNFRCMIIITHIDELKTYSDKFIDIERHNNCSKIVYAGFADNDSHVKSMLKMKLTEEIKLFADNLEKSRVKKNENQKKIRDDREATRTKRDEEKKKIREDREAIVAKVESIMLDNNLIKSHIIELFTKENVSMFKCKGCNKTYTASDIKINAHVGSISYKAKHKRYIKSVL